MTKLIIQYRCETPEAFAEGLNAVKGAGFSPGVITNFDQQKDHRCELCVHYRRKDLAGDMTLLEQCLLSVDGVVPETVRATIAVPQDDPVVVGQYVDFLEAKIDHLMIRGLNQQREIDTISTSVLQLTESLNRLSHSIAQANGMYAHLEQQGITYHPQLIQALGNAMALHFGENPLADVNIPIPIH